MNNSSQTLDDDYLDYSIPWIYLTKLNKTVDDKMDPGKSDTERKLSIAQSIFLVLAILGIFGNSITILALSKSKKLRNATTAFIVNLCVADLLYCVFTFVNFLEPDWNHNSHFCRWFPAARYLVAGESVYTLVAITINRYICVVHPSKYRSWYRTRNLAIMILLTWLYALTMCLLPFFEVWGYYGYDPTVAICSVLRLNGRSPKNFFFISAFAFPTFAFAACYPRIFYVVHKASKQVRKFTAAQLTSVTPLSEVATQEVISSSAPPQVRDERELRILKVMLVIVLGFIICYFPVAFIKIFEKEREMPLFTVIAYLGINLSNVINPVIYVVMSPEYRKAYMELFFFKKMWTLLQNSFSSD